MTATGTNALTVVVPARNAEHLLPGCLASLARNRPAELIVVDGCSTDRTVSVSQEHGARVLSDEGRGLPVARLQGAQAAQTPYVALIDADVIVPDGALGALLDEFLEGGFAALQADQHSVSGPGYWGQALVHHHRSGRSRRWLGLVATIFEREYLLGVGFDPRFPSGEDIDLRWRLRQAGAKTGVSHRVTVTHRYAGDDFAFARDQFTADGAGLGRMVRTRGFRGARLLALPAAAAARGITLSLVHGDPEWVPYYLRFAQHNYAAMGKALRHG